jgi:N-carbamoyl-L-amino-acid hydrolase
VDAGRLLGVLSSLAEIGADPLGGVTRHGFSPEDARAIGHLSGLARRAGLQANVDQAGNLLMRRATAADTAPVLLIGSHLDTVTNGGPLDGAYGVVAGLEVLRVLSENAVPLAREPVVVAFANEEGARFPEPFLGSRALTGQLGELPHDVHDRNGESLRRALRAVGGDFDSVADARWPGGAIAGYLELHIEQGPVLEQAGVPIGVVDAITGRVVFAITLSGTAGHAGTLPMRLRRDPLVAAAQLVLDIESVARDGLCMVATVGCVDVRPNVTNVVPGIVQMTAEVRDGDEGRLVAAEQTIATAITRLREQAGVRVQLSVTARTAPVRTDQELRREISAAATGLGLTTMRLSSGAGHDAQIVGAVAPMGMIFVPSHGGVSHVPEEHTEDVDLVAGANVLLHTVLEC